MISFGDGAHETQIGMLRRAAEGRWTVEPLREGQEPDRPDSLLLRLERVDADGMHGQLVETGEPSDFDWITYPHVHIY